MSPEKRGRRRLSGFEDETDGREAQRAAGRPPRRLRNRAQRAGGRLLVQHDDETVGAGRQPLRRNLLRVAGAGVAPLSLSPMNPSLLPRYRAADDADRFLGGKTLLDTPSGQEFVAHLSATESATPAQLEEMWFGNCTNAFSSSGALQATII